MLALADLIPKSVARAHSYPGAKISALLIKTRRNPVADITPQNAIARVLIRNPKVLLLDEVGTIFITSLHTC